MGIRLSTYGEGKASRSHKLVRPTSGIFIVLLLLLGVFPVVVAPAAAAAEPSVAFDYRMPSRFFGVAMDVPISPTSWPVELDACASAGAVYRWTVDGALVNESAACLYLHDFPAEGSYEVTLEVQDDTGATATTNPQVVVVQDWLIFGFGDSYGSGEGIPEDERTVQDWIDKEDAKTYWESKAAEIRNLKVGEKWKADLALDSWQRCQFACFFERLALEIALGDIGITDVNELIDLGYRTVLRKIEERTNELEAAVAYLGVVYDSLALALKGKWQDDACHRSRFSGQALAALALEELDPRTSVTFIHLACTGATISGSTKNLTGVGGQFDQAKELLGANPREIDAVVTSVGGNDLGFATAVTACAWQDACHVDNSSRLGDLSSFYAPVCALIPFAAAQCTAFFASLAALAPNSGLDVFTDGLLTLNGRWATVRTDLETYLGKALPGTNGERVFITEYPDSTRATNGAICPEDLLLSVPGLSVDEGKWASDTVVPALNAAIENAATRNDWTYVTGISAPYRTHGYCADEPWVVSVLQSFFRQDDYNGMLHPNKAGQLIYRDQILKALRQDLYTNGDLAQPRLPQHPPVVSPGGPYVLNEGDTVDLVGVAIDPDGDPIQTWRWETDGVPEGAIKIEPTDAPQAVLTGIDDASGQLILHAADMWWTGTGSTELRVLNVAPVADAGERQIVDEGATVTLQGQFEDPGHDDWEESWRMVSSTNGQLVPPEDVSKLEFVPVDDGLYVFEFRVEDDDGGVGLATTEVIVGNVAPAVGAAGSSIEENDIARVSGTISDPGVLDDFDVMVDWGDGATEPYVLPAATTEFEFSHRYLDDDPSGTPVDRYNVELSVRDKDGGIGATSVDVVVTNIDPVVSIEAVVDQFGVEIGADPVLVGLEITSTERYSDVGTLDTRGATRDWGDGLVEDLGAVTDSTYGSHRYSKAGHYRIEVVVTDDDTGVAGASRTIEVIAPYEGVRRVLNDIDEIDATEPEAASRLAAAAEDLRGSADGRGRNGALNALAQDNRARSIRKLLDALTELDAASAADPSLELHDLQQGLAHAAQSILVQTLDQLDPSSMRGGELRRYDEASQLLDEGVALLGAAEYVEAVDRFEQAIKRL